MVQYRIYLLGIHGQIRSAREAECADDAEALALASTFANPGQEAEVWSGTRSLGRVRTG